MNEQIYRSVTSAFFKLDTNFDCTGYATDKFQGQTSASLYLKRIPFSLAKLKDRISTLEGRETAGLARNSLTYVDDMQFCDWLKSGYIDSIS